MWYYQTKKDDSEVIDKLKELAESHPTRGFDEYYKKLRREGYKWNRKRVLRVYRKRLVSRVRNPLVAPKELNVCWSMDFMSDALYDGRKVRTFNIIDDCNREALAIDVGLNYPSRRVIETLEQLEEEIGLPEILRCDNGPEFISKILQQWCRTKRIELRYTQPGKPMQNGYIERFNRFYREDVLDAFWFNDLHQLRKLTKNWMEDYNSNHPHKSLGDKPPREYMPRFVKEFKFFNKSDNNYIILSNLEVS